jgi:hypothetical protein
LHLWWKVPLPLRNIISTWWLIDCASEEGHNNGSHETMSDCSGIKYLAERVYPFLLRQKQFIWKMK